jgi:hypothetical protein
VPLDLPTLIQVTGMIEGIRHPRIFVPVIRCTKMVGTITREHLVGLAPSVHGVDGTSFLIHLLGQGNPTRLHQRYSGTIHD